MAALLFHGMRERHEWQTWPVGVRLELENSARQAVAAELLRQHHLEEVQHCFARSDLRFLLTKGEALARTHYPVPGTRTRSDSDIFIHIKDIEKASQAVIDAGFRIVSPTYKTHQFTVRKMAGDDPGLEFDIHWRILNAARFARSISFEEAHADSVELPGAGGVRTLSAEHSLLLACMHLAGSEWHDQNRLIWIYDIHVLASGFTDRELVEFAEYALRKNVQSACRDGLDKAIDFFGTGISFEVLSRLGEPEKSRRFSNSNLGLLLDDWKSLRGGVGRRALLKELFFPPAKTLSAKYGHANRYVRPLLYLRHILGGLSERITLR